MQKANGYLWILVFAGAMIFASCDNDDDDNGSSADMDSDVDTDKRSMGPGTFSEDYATSEDYFTQMGGMLTGKSPHGKVQIWYSTSVRDVIKDESFVAPEGTVSVKKFDTEGDGVVDGLVVMIKKETGYDVENNNWRYEVRNAEGVLAEDPAPGKIEMCISCHKKWRAKDFLGGTEIFLNDGPGAFTADYETRSDFFTNMSDMTEGNSPHGKVQIWYSRNIKNLIENESFVVPKGTTSIKKYDADKDGTPDGLAVMVKQGADFDSDNNNWHYEMRTLDGTLMNDPAPGKNAGCISCHQNWKGKDFLGGTQL